MSDSPRYEPRLHIVLHQPEIRITRGAWGGHAWRPERSCGGAAWLGFRIDDYYLRAGLDDWQHLEWEAVDDWDSLVARLPTGSRGTSPRRQSGVTPMCGLPREMASCSAASRKELPLVDARGERGAVAAIADSPAGESLNLSNAVGIVTFEMLRQLRERGRE